MSPRDATDANQKALDYLAQGMGETSAEEVISGATRGFTARDAMEMAKAVAAKLSRLRHRRARRAAATLMHAVA